jgi:hypothetical protein
VDPEPGGPKACGFGSGTLVPSLHFMAISLTMAADNLKKTERLERICIFFYVNFLNSIMVPKKNLKKKFDLSVENFQ